MTEASSRTQIFRTPNGTLVHRVVPSRRSRRIANWFWAIVAASIVIIVCFAVIFTLRRPTSKGEATGGQDGKANKNSPSIQIKRERYAQFRTALAHHASEPYKFVNPYSPQSRALEWMVYHDQVLPNARTVKNNQQGLNMSNTSNHDEDFSWKLLQRYSLMVLAYATSGAGGRSWRGIVPWDHHVNMDECSADFQGVECDSVSGKVTAISLVSRNLNGQIPEQIGLLTELTNLDLSENMLEGRLPHRAYQLRHLEHLALSDNEFAFQFTDEIGNLTNLKQLLFADTLVSGSMPVTMRNLTELNVLVAINTDLEGDLLRFLPHWRKLEFFMVDGAKGITGTVPTEIGLMTDLRYLGIQNTGIRGSLPSEIGQLTNLGQISFGGEFLTGTLPSEVGNCEELQTMILTPAPRVTGSIPTTISNLSSLYFLVISGTSIRGAIPSEIGKLSALATLNVENNLLYGAFPSQLENLAALTNLQINANYLTGTFPKGICDIPNILVWMDCSEGLVCEEDCCPKAWCSFGNPR